MRPPYDFTPTILKLLTAVSERIGELQAVYLIKQSPKLRKQNQIKTIHASLNIEGNALSEDQITAIIEDKRVVGPEKDIVEVLNALEVYKNIQIFKCTSEKDFLAAHKMLMKGLIKTPGAYRKQGVGIVKGSKVTHLAPPASNVPYLMKELFTYLKNKSELTLIKSCVFHYEMEFIHPFMDGNGRIGRLWQTVILMKEYPLFEFLPFESLIAKNQQAYYQALSASDKEGKSTKFIEYMLEVIKLSLEDLLATPTQKLDETERLKAFLLNKKGEFTRKDYMRFYPDLSPATASRDLKNGVQLGLISKWGDKRMTFYKGKK
jgi:Fic family protein